MGYTVLHISKKRLYRGNKHLNKKYLNARIACRGTRLVGIAGFEPTNDGVKVRCLTAWLYPRVRGAAAPHFVKVLQFDLAIKRSILLGVNSFLRIGDRFCLCALVFALKRSREACGLAIALACAAGARSSSSAVALAVVSGLCRCGDNNLAERLFTCGMAVYALDFGNLAVDNASFVGIHRFESNSSALF